MYNISEIQKGIQCYHAGMEYALRYFNDEDFQEWLNNEKTVILLNGGTSSSRRYYEGTMEKHYDYLAYELKIKCAVFSEPDLNYCMSAIAFLVPETVYDKETYPDFEISTPEYKFKGSDFSEFLEKNIDFQKGLKVREYVKIQYNNWIDLIGGESNRRLRVFLQQFRLA
jgi:hypothetical protein